MLPSREADIEVETRARVFIGQGYISLRARFKQGLWFPLEARSVRRT